MSNRKDSRLDNIHDEDNFINEAKERSQSDLNEISEMKQESNRINKEVKRQLLLDHWAYTIHRALGGSP